MRHPIILPHKILKILHILQTYQTNHKKTTTLFGIIEQYFGCLAFQSGGDANLLPICPYFPNDDDPGPGHSILWIIWVSAEITIIN